MSHYDDRLIARQKSLDAILTQRGFSDAPLVREMDLAERNIDRVLMGKAEADKPQAPAKPLGPMTTMGSGRTKNVPSLGGAYSAELGAAMGKGFSVTDTGITDKPTGRPKTGRQPRVRLAAPGSKAANRRTWLKARKSRPAAISEKLWSWLELHYFHGYQPHEIAEQIKPRVKERSVSQGLSRARKLAREAGIHFQ